MVLLRPCIGSASTFARFTYALSDQWDGHVCKDGANDNKQASGLVPICECDLPVVLSEGDPDPILRLHCFRASKNEYT